MSSGFVFVQFRSNETCARRGDRYPQTRSSEVRCFHFFAPSKRAYKNHASRRSYWLMAFKYRVFDPFLFNRKRRANEENNKKEKEDGPSSFVFLVDEKSPRPLLQRSFFFFFFRHEDVRFLLGEGWQTALLPRRNRREWGGGRTRSARRVGRTAFPLRQPTRWLSLLDRLPPGAVSARGSSTRLPFQKSSRFPLLETRSFENGEITRKY